MRRTLHLLGMVFWYLLTFDILIACVDWAARWDWLNQFLAANPHIAAFVRTPFAYALLLFLGFLFLKAETKLKLPNITARFANSRTIPNLKTTTLEDVFKTESKAAGWDLRPLNWHWFLEIYLVNESETPVTIEDIEIEVKVGKWPRRKTIPAKLVQDLSRFQIDMALDGTGQPHNKPFELPRRRPVPSLMEKIKGVPIAKWIGYRGWVRIELPGVSQKDINNGNTRIEIWLVDALEGKHKLNYKRHADTDWDNSFFIFYE
jgi:hypothetical protein